MDTHRNSHKHSVAAMRKIREENLLLYRFQLSRIHGPELLLRAQGRGFDSIVPSQFFWYSDPSKRRTQLMYRQWCPSNQTPTMALFLDSIRPMKDKGTYPISMGPSTLCLELFKGVFGTPVYTVLRISWVFGLRSGIPPTS